MWEDKEMIKSIINECNNKSDVLRKLNLKILAGNYDTLNRYIDKYNIDITHFNRKMHIQNKHNSITKIPLNEILVKNSKYTNRTRLKIRLYSEGLKEKKCDMCGQTEIWFGKKISLILDHINGINNDNRLENLRIICPNCNATLDTHCSKNIHKKSELNKKIIVTNVIRY